MTLGKIIVIFSSLIFPWALIYSIRDKEEQLYPIVASISFAVIMYMIFVYGGIY